MLHFWHLHWKMQNVVVDDAGGSRSGIWDVSFVFYDFLLHWKMQSYIWNKVIHLFILFYNWVKILLTWLIKLVRCWSYGFVDTEFTIIAASSFEICVFLSSWLSILCSCFGGISFCFFCNNYFCIYLWWVLIQLAIKRSMLVFLFLVQVFLNFLKYWGVSLDNLHTLAALFFLYDKDEYYVPHRIPYTSSFYCSVSEHDHIVDIYGIALIHLWFEEARLLYPVPVAHLEIQDGGMGLATIK